VIEQKYILNSMKNDNLKQTDNEDEIYMDGLFIGKSKEFIEEDDLNKSAPGGSTIFDKKNVKLYKIESKSKSQKKPPELIQKDHGNNKTPDIFDVKKVINSISRIFSIIAVDAVKSVGKIKFWKIVFVLIAILVLMSGLALLFSYLSNFLRVSSFLRYWF